MRSDGPGAGSVILSWRQGAWALKRLPCCSSFNCVHVLMVVAVVLACILTGVKSHAMVAANERSHAVNEVYADAAN
jgi:hypothetical protein